jgi:hypothetical protein
MLLSRVIDLCSAPDEAGAVSFGKGAGNSEKTERKLLKMFEQFCLNSIKACVGEVLCKCGDTVPRLRRAVHARL